MLYQCHHVCLPFPVTVNYNLLFCSVQANIFSTTHSLAFTVTLLWLAVIGQGGNDLVWTVLLPLFRSVLMFCHFELRPKLLAETKPLTTLGPKIFEGSHSALHFLHTLSYLFYIYLFICFSPILLGPFDLRCHFGQIIKTQQTS